MTRLCPALRSLCAEFFEHQNESIPGHPYKTAGGDETLTPPPPLTTSNEPAFGRYKIVNKKYKSTFM